MFSESPSIPTLAPSESLGICNSSGAAGYEISKSFKMRIKTEEDELSKIEKTEAVSMEIIDGNTHCSDYTYFPLCSPQ